MASKSKEHQAGNDEAPEQDRDELARLAILDAIGAAGGDATDYSVFVFRISGPDKKRDGTESRLFTCTVQDLETVADRLAHDFGEGVYRFRVRKEGRAFGRYWDTGIELSPEDRRAFAARNRSALVPAAEATPAPAAAAAPASGGLDLAAILRSQNEMLLAVLKDRSAPTPAADPIGQFAAMMAAFKSFQEALPKPAAQTGADTFKQVLELAKELSERGGDREGGSGVLGLVEKLLSNPAELIKALKELNQAPAIEARAQPTPARVTAQPAPAAAPPAANPADQAMAYLLGQAEAGMQPELCAETAVKMIPEAVFLTLDDLLDEKGYAGALDYLQNLYPDVGKHRPWFEALVRAMYSAEEEEEAPANAGQDAAKPEGAGPVQDPAAPG